MKNRVIITMTDEGGPETVLQVSVQGDLTKGAGHMASRLLSDLALAFAQIGQDGFAKSYSDDIKRMIQYHAGVTHDTPTITPPSRADKG